MSEINLKGVFTRLTLNCKTKSSWEKLEKKRRKVGIICLNQCFHKEHIPLPFIQIELPSVWEMETLCETLKLLFRCTPRIW